MGTYASPSSPTDSETLSPRIPPGQLGDPGRAPCAGSGVCGVIRKRCWGRDQRPLGPQTIDSGWNRPVGFPVGNLSVSTRPSLGDGEGGRGGH